MYVHGGHCQAGNKHLEVADIYDRLHDGLGLERVIFGLSSGNAVEIVRQVGT